MEIEGKIKLIGDTIGVSKSFKKRELVIATEEQYPQFISITFVQDKTELLDKYRLGESVKVFINLRGREWVNDKGETKYFNDIQGWRIEKVAEGSNIEVHEAQFEPATNLRADLDPENDLPF